MTTKNLNYTIESRQMIKAQFEATFERKTKPPERFKLKAGFVEVQWKCSEAHADCAARTWKRFGQLDQGEAAARVRDYNDHSSFFNYRVKP